MKKFFFLCLLFFCGNVFSQNYDASLINDSLKENANAVKRFEELRVIIKSNSKAIVKHKYAITILKEAGANLASYHNYYSKLLSLSNISGTLYDAHGKEIKSVKKKEIGDYSAIGEESLMSDSRVKQHNFYCSQYPYTIEYEDEQELDGIFFLPSWNPIDIECSVEQSDFFVETPIDYQIHFKQVAYSNQPIQTEDKNKRIYSWQIKNAMAVSYEPYQPHWDEINTAVYIAPAQFEIGDYKGEMSSWKNLGLFIKDLNNGRQELPDNIKADIHKLTDHVTETSEKVKLLYDYLQKNTRYISVQIGMGGWQTYDAKYVATKKYGDCKALSNYMVSLLKEMKLPAKYVLVNAGTYKKGLTEDFPSPYFNHAIMCVPLPKDTIWLECTSQTNSAGFMGSFTGNRKALLIDDDGGHVVTTPVYKAKDNLQLRKVYATISEEGTLAAEVDTHYTGIQQEEVNGLMHSFTEEEKKKYLNNTLNLPTYSVEKFNYKETMGLIPSVDEHLSITALNYATITGKRFFITPNFFNRSTSKLEEDKKRKYDIQFFASFIDVDTIQIKIPANYAVESMPKDVVLKTAYGNYSISYSIKDNFINVLRKNERNEGRFAKSEYEAIVTYFKTIYKADRNRIVLTKN
jgi:hypothetical protein